MNKPTTDNPTDERLDALLAAADPAFCPADIECACRDDLPQRVMCLHRARRRKRRVAGAALCIASAAMVSFILISFNTRTAPTTVAVPSASTPTSKSDLKTELAQLRKNISQLRKAIKHPYRQSQYRRRLAELRRRSDRPDPLVVAQNQIEKTAFILVARAAREESQGRPGSDPTATYRKTIELFPGTTWAKVAQYRLEKHQRRTNSFSNSKQEGQL